MVGGRLHSARPQDHRLEAQALQERQREAPSPQHCPWDPDAPSIALAPPSLPKKHQDALQRYHWRVPTGLHLLTERISHKPDTSEVLGGGDVQNPPHLRL